MIGLSPPPTAHPKTFQCLAVRTSTDCDIRFILAMGRSLGFGSWACDSGRPIRTRFRYGCPSRVNLATHRKLAGSFFKRHAVTPQPQGLSRLPRLVGARFQVLFHSPPGVLFTFPSRYLSAIGHQGVFRLSGWSRQIHTEFQESRATWECIKKAAATVYGGITHYARPFQTLRLTANG